MSMEYINKIEQHDFHIIGEIGLDKLDRDSWRQQLIFLKFFLNEYKAQKILSDYFPLCQSLSRSF